MKSCFLFALLIPCFYASAQTTTSDKLVPITMELYSLTYPDSWTADTSKTFGMDLLLRSPKTDTLDQFIENMNVFVQNLSGQNYNLSRMGKESETQIKNMVTEAEILESRLDSTSSHQYYVLKYRGRHGKFVLITEQRYYLKNEIGIALTFTVQNDEEKKYQAKSTAIFKSFKLL
jgi:hypothetical protein